ncbi:zinc finger protein OZF-like [Aricia agestis]|uniref:zinc finger protein OZF-like n=1 Tax=Aricia agestis TaxID=91739 RepID=UPI001C203A2F|nr:zinc finger protein OZF-like [Aricia agestis]
MLKKAYCYLCLSVNKRTINIFKTNLQCLYEKLADLKLTENECWMCYICHTRLQQCLRLQQLAMQTRGLIDGVFQNKIKIECGAIKSLLELSQSKTKITSETHTSSSCVKQEAVIDRPYVDDHNETQYASNSKEEKKCIKFEVQPVKQEYLEGREQTAWPEQNLHAVMKIEIEALGTEQDEQEIANDSEGVNSQSHKKPLTCEVCLKTFTYKSQLVRHTIIHINEKPHNCDVCGKKFADKNNLKKHQRTHTGYKPYNCEVCSKKFIQRSALTNHMRTHTGEKPFSCDVCSKKFSMKPSLEIHMKIHTGDKPYSCDYCERKFIERSTLLNHIKTHTGEKPFMCDICSKKFSMRAALNNHMRTHTGDKPFSCEICFKNFSRTSHLSRHRKNIHNRIGRAQV